MYHARGRLSWVGRQNGLCHNDPPALQQLAVEFRAEPNAESSPELYGMAGAG